MTDALRTTRDVALAAAIAACLYVSGPLSLFTPLPFLWAFIRRGRVWGVASIALSLAAVAVFYSYVPLAASAGSLASISAAGGERAAAPAPALIWAMGMGFFPFFAAVAAALAMGARRRWGLEMMGGCALLVGLAALAAVSAGIFLVVGNSAEELRAFAAGAVSRAIEAQGLAAGHLSGSGLMDGQAERIIAFVIEMAPSLVFVSALLCVAFNILLGRRIIKGKRGLAHLRNAARFRLPDWAIWGPIACGAAYFADGYLIGSGWLKIAAANGLVALGSLYFLQGLAVVAYFLQRIKLPLLKAAAYLTILIFFQTAGMLIVGVGIADVWTNFRMRLLETETRN